MILGSKIQRLQILKVLLVVLLSSFIIIGGMYVVSIVKKVPPEFLTEDPLGTANFPWYTGALSNLGVIFWSIALGVSATGVFLFRSKTKAVNLLIGNTVLTAILDLDDMFMLHESFLKYRLHIPEFASYMFYILIILIYLAFFYRVILSDNSFLLLAGMLVFLGFSMGFDSFSFGLNIGVFLKSSMKFVSIALWMAYNFVFLIRVYGRQASVGKTSQ
jgi:hypothetical protein